MAKKTGEHKSGDPSKREYEEYLSKAMKSPMFWQEFRHGCGCYLAWGTPVPNDSMVTHKLAQERMFRFFTSIKQYPCPMHGSASGVPAEPLLPGQWRYMPANNVWYRECPPGREVYGDRVSDHLKVPDLRVEAGDGDDEGDAYPADPHDPDNWCNQ